MDKKTIRSVEDVYTFTPFELIEAMQMGNFLEYIPGKVETAEDMDRIAGLLPTIVNKYSFLMSILSSLKVSIRNEKRDGDKKKAEDLIDKQTILSNAVDILKMQQKTLSRIITIKQMVNEEMNMY